MSKKLEDIDVKLAEWIGLQKIFFVGTSPLSSSGHVNVSPKGGDSFRVLGPLEVAYLDYTGSGAETAAHLRENGRIVIMFCAFEGPPKIVRLHGTGTVVESGDPEFERLISHFPENPGTRSIVRIQVERVSDSCGYSIPYFDYVEPRETLDKWAANKGKDGLVEYRSTKNRSSIDGLPAFDPPSEI